MTPRMVDRNPENWQKRLEEAAERVNRAHDALPEIFDEADRAHQALFDAYSEAIYHFGLVQADLARCQHLPQRKTEDEIRAKLDSISDDHDWSEGVAAALTWVLGLRADL